MTSSEDSLVLADLIKFLLGMVVGVIGMFLLIFILASVFPTPPIPPPSVRVPSARYKAGGLSEMGAVLDGKAAFQSIDMEKPGLDVELRIVPSSN